MARTKGAKNKPKEAPAITGGNPDFNLTGVEPSETIGRDVAPGAVMPEDLELERSLQSMVSDVPPIDDPEPIGSVVKKEIEKREMLGDHVDDYKPASTLEELREQVFLAKSEGCDSLEITPDLAKKICRDPSLEKVGYFIYHDIKAYLVGHFEKAKARDNVTIERRLFGHSTEAERKKMITDKIKALEQELNGN